jgi:hypothetical protein
MYVDGDSSNAGVITGCSAAGNSGWGFYDSSFLGNTYVGCHTEDNLGGAYKSDNLNARNVFLGCYSESGQPASDIIPPSIIIGGLHAASISDGTKGVVSADTSSLTTDMLRAMESIITPALQMNGPNNAWRLRYHSGDDIKFDWANQGAGIGYYVAGPNTVYGNDTGRALPYAFCATNLCVGINSPRRIDSAGSLPASGIYAKGDIILNNSPVAGGSIGWVCTTSGAVGAGAVFKTFGLISP